MFNIVLNFAQCPQNQITQKHILRDWSVEQILIDTIWGGLLTGFFAWAGGLIARLVG